MSLRGAEMGVEEAQEIEAEDDEPPIRKDAIRTVVADDHPIVRYALRQMLTHCEIDVVGECVVGPGVLEIVANTQADILLIDLRMSDSQVWSILQTLAEVGNAARCIILTASEDKKQLIHALKMGCAGIILKQATAEEIASCIRNVYRGEVWLDPRIAGVLGEIDPQKNDEKAVRAMRSGNQVTLGKREHEVLALIAHGYTNPEIAAKLFISGHTVKNHVHNLYKKTGLTSRAELVIHAIHNGLVSHHGRP